MNNLQWLYESSADFQHFLTNHLVVFEHWYKWELGDTRIEDDVEAHNWLMAEHCSTGSEYNDGKLPEPCMHLDYAGDEVNSIELADGTGFVRVDSINSSVERMTKELATASSDFEALLCYSTKLRDLLETAYEQAMHFYEMAPRDRIIMDSLNELTQIHDEMQELGFEV